MSRAYVFSFAMIGLLVAIPSFSRADPQRRPEQPGEVFYRRYCASCHGPEAKGDGTLAPVLTRKPPDLTRIASRNGGEFPYWKVRKIVDGTTTVRAHGDADMPVWGETFRDEASWGLARRAEVQGKLTFLTDYLQSIQRE